MVHGPQLPEQPTAAAARHAEHSRPHFVDSVAEPSVITIAVAIRSQQVRPVVASCIFIGCFFY